MLRLLLKMLVFTFLFSNSPPVFADSFLKDDLGLWTPVYLTFPVKGKIKGSLEANPRIVDNISDFDQLLIRPAIGYKLTENFSLWQGYAWVSSYRPEFLNENRIFQQLLYENKFLWFNLTHRGRFEERFIEDTESASLRARYMLRSMLPFGKLKKWAFVIYDELFLNLNSSNNGPNAGFDQNRLFCGINKKFSEKVNAEIGYQMQLINRQGPKVDKLNHIILLNIYLDL